MSITDLLTNRQIVYKFAPEKLKDETIIDLTDAARAAPNPVGIYEYEIIIVTDEDTKQEISRICITPNIHTAPVVFVIVCDEDKIRNVFEEKADEICVDNAALAANALVLRAQELGLGNAMITNVDQKEMKTLLNIPDKYIVRWVIPVGHPAEETVGYKPSLPKASEMVHLEKF